MIHAAPIFAPLSLPTYLTLRHPAMNPTQRTPYQRNRPSPSTPQYHPLITWRFAGFTPTALRLDWGAPQYGLVVTGVPRIIRVRDTQPPSAIVYDHLQITLEYPGAMMPSDQFTVPQADPAILTSLGQPLAPGFVIPPPVTPPITAIAGSYTAPNFQIEIAGGTGPLYMIAAPDVYSVGLNLYANVQYVYPYLYCDWGGSDPGPGTQIDLLTPGPTIIDAYGAWLQPATWIT